MECRSNGVEAGGGGAEGGGIGSQITFGIVKVE